MKAPFILLGAVLGGVIACLIPEKEKSIKKVATEKPEKEEIKNEPVIIPASE